MAHELAIAVIHGMGSQNRGFSDAMKDEINKRVGEAKASKIRWEEIYWADVLEPRQKAYLKRAKAGNDLDFVGLRKFVISALGDASAYRKTPDAKDMTYRNIHKRVRDVIGKLDDSATPPVPLIIMAHSLGGHIISNYIFNKLRFFR